MLARERKELIDPAMKAVRNENKVQRARVAKVEGLHSLAEQLCELHRQRDLVRWLRMEGRFDEATRLLKKVRGTTDETLKLFLKIAERNDGSIDAAEVRGFITMAMNNWIQDEEKAIAAKDRKPPMWLDRNLAETEKQPGEVNSN
jgi:alpha-L-fucosidase